MGFFTIRSKETQGTDQVVMMERLGNPFRLVCLC